METETLISMGAASKLYGVSRRTIERLIKSGDLPYHRIGRQIRLSPADLHKATGRNAGKNLCGLQHDATTNQATVHGRADRGAIA